MFISGRYKEILQVSNHFYAWISKCSGCHAVSTGKWLQTFHRSTVAPPSEPTLTLMMEAQCSSEMRVSISHSTQRNTEEALNLHQHHCVNLRSCTTMLVICNLNLYGHFKKQNIIKWTEFPFQVCIYETFHENTLGELLLEKLIQLILHSWTYLSINSD